MIDTTLLGDIGNGFQGQFSSTFDLTKPKQILFLYSPRMYGTQVLRPYAYQFGADGVDMLMNSSGSMTKTLENPRMATDPRIAGMIAPVANGTKLDMAVINELWTFTLMVDIMSTSFGGAAKLRRRFVYQGVCLDEPISMLTMWSGSPTPNLNCPMRFTHVTEVMVDPRVSSMGAVPRTIVRTDADILDSSLNTQAGEELYAATPDKMLERTDAGSGIHSEGIAALSASDRGVGVLSTIKSPLAHLRTLCMGLDQQIHLSEAGVGNTVVGSMSRTTDPYSVDDFKTGVVGEWGQACTSPSMLNGDISPDSIMLLGRITNVFPDIAIVPFKFSNPQSPAQLGGAVMDQESVDPKTVFSSMVNAAVNATALQFGFAQLHFIVDTAIAQGTGPTDAEVWFDPDLTKLLLPPDDYNAAQQTMAGAVEGFRMQLKMDLIPTINAAKLGPFRLEVMFSLNGDTYVDLNFYDFASIGEGIMETGNRITNCNSPNASNAQHFINNGCALDVLVHNVFGKSINNSFGRSAFGDDRGEMLNTMEADTISRLRM
jgi:hypothetical protein